MRFNQFIPNMKKFLAIFILIIMPFGFVALAQSNNLKKINPDKLKKVISNPPKTTGEKVVLNTSNTTRLIVTRDGDGNTSTGTGYYISFNSNGVNGTVCEFEDGLDNGVSTLDGLINGYYKTDSKILKQAIDLVNSSNLYKTGKKSKVSGKKGSTQLEVYKNGEKWLDIRETPNSVNFKGDLNALVDKLVELAGGEPKYGGPLGNGDPEPEELYHEDEDENWLYY